MKSFFEIYLIIFITFTMFISMMFFAEEIVIQQEGLHLRNRIIEIIETKNGYTNEAKQIVEELIDNSKRDIDINVTKTGKLNYGEKIRFEIKINHERKLPFKNKETVTYRTIGEYYNVNG